VFTLLLCCGFACLVLRRRLAESEAEMNYEIETSLDDGYSDEFNDDMLEELSCDNQFSILSCLLFCICGEEAGGDLTGLELPE
jgi:hypothetical protein